MSDYPEALQRLIEELGRLPGIGQRGAERLATYLLKVEREEALGLADAIRTVKDSLQPCRACFNFSEAALCPVCSDEERDRTKIMVVESPKDLVAFERTGRYGGLYHVLMGHVSPHEGSALRHLTAERLIERVGIQRLSFSPSADQSRAIRPPSCRSTLKVIRRLPKPSGCID